MYKIIISSIILLVLFASCEKEIDIDMPEHTPSVVIEGYIINDMQPVVVLTNNIKYASESGIQTYEASFIHDALVTITTNNEKTDTLVEVENIDPESGLKTYIYSSPTLYGEVGSEYLLKVTVQGKSYSANAIIPEPVPIKEIWYEEHPDADNEDYKLVWVKIQDPVGINYYKYGSEVNGKHGPQPEISTIIDDAFEGQEYSKSIDSGLENEEDDMHGGVSGYFITGDTVTVKWLNVEKSYYDIWTSIDYKRTQSMNPFMEPTRIVGNIDGALGYWSGIGGSAKTIVLKDN